MQWSWSTIWQLSRERCGRIALSGRVATAQNLRELLVPALCIHPVSRRETMAKYLSVYLAGAAHRWRWERRSFTRLLKARP
jgi:hypothetical protein